MSQALLLSRKFAAVVLFLSVPALLLCLALARFWQSVSAEAFRNVIISASLGERLPPQTYRAAADALATTAYNDGDTLSERARALALSADTDPKVLDEARTVAASALQYAPANPDASLLLCQIKARQLPIAAGRCLDYAFSTAPYDWYTTEGRMLATASVWPYLTAHMRDKAVRLILPMWNTQGWMYSATLRGVLYELSATESGRQLLRAGFANHRDELRDFNRYVIRRNAGDQ